MKIITTPSSASLDARVVAEDPRGLFTRFRLRGTHSISTLRIRSCDPRIESIVFLVLNTKLAFLCAGTSTQLGQLGSRFSCSLGVHRLGDLDRDQLSFGSQGLASLDHRKLDVAIHCDARRLVYLHRVSPVHQIQGCEAWARRRKTCVRRLRVVLDVVRVRDRSRSVHVRRR